VKTLWSLKTNQKYSKMQASLAFLIYFGTPREVFTYGVAAQPEFPGEPPKAREEGGGKRLQDPLMNEGV
jgi:hypothetical protein